MKTIGVYKITNTVTGDFYVGSSRDVKSRWTTHKCPSTWKMCPNSSLYKDMQKLGTDKFSFQILAEVEIEHLKETEQKFIETLNPTYNDRNAKGFDFDRHEKYLKERRQSEKYKARQKKYQKKYRQSEKYKERQKERRQSEKYKASNKKANNKYYNRLCCYNGETLTLSALEARFQKKGFDHPTQEAKKYLL